MKETRQHETEITLPASPEEVWRAITEASALETWYAPEVRVDAREGGEYFVSWGPGMEGGGHIETFEPGKHLRLIHERTLATETVRMAIDFYLESEGGSTKLRLVHSGFLLTSDWDGEFNGTKQGWPIMLRILRYGLSTHSRVSGRQQWLYHKANLPQHEAYARFAAEFAGTTPEYKVEGEELCVPWPRFGDGLVYAAFGERKGVTGISVYVVEYDDAVAQLTQAAEWWKGELERLYSDTLKG